MSELQDAIKVYGATNLARILRADPAFRILNLIWRTPDAIEQAFTRMGWTTTKQVTDWVGQMNVAVGNPEAFAALVAPEVVLDMSVMPVVGIDVIHKAIVEQAGIRSDFAINQSDGNYRLASKTQLEWLGSICPVRSRTWVAETMDCDDFANAFRGWLAHNGLGNLAQGFCGLTMYDWAGNIAGGHALVLVMDDTKKLWFLEPQNGKLYEVTYPHLGNILFAKSVKIVLANF